MNRSWPFCEGVSNFPALLMYLLPARGRRGMAHRLCTKSKRVHLSESYWLDFPLALLFFFSVCFGSMKISPGNRRFMWPGLPAADPDREDQSLKSGGNRAYDWLCTGRKEYWTVDCWTVRIIFQILNNWESKLLMSINNWSLDEYSFMNLINCNYPYPQAHQYKISPTASKFQPRPTQFV